MDNQKISKNIINRTWPLLVENVLLKMSTLLGMIMVGSLMIMNFTFYPRCL